MPPGWEALLKNQTQNRKMGRKWEACRELAPADGKGCLRQGVNPPFNICSPIVGISINMCRYIVFSANMFPDPDLSYDVD